MKDLVHLFQQIEEKDKQIQELKEKVNYMKDAIFTLQYKLNKRKELTNASNEPTWEKKIIVYELNKGKHPVITQKIS